MQLYLIRHAEAAPADADTAEADAARPLTEFGSRQARAVAEALKAHSVAVGRILTSPLLRARQTAEVIAQGLGEPGPQVCQHLAPGGKRRRLSKAVCDAGVQAVALVGHDPDLPEYLAWLIGSRKAQIALAKAGVACVECDDDPGKGAGVLHWLLTPLWAGVESAGD